jgi:putative ABC transport system permease protein
MIGYQLRISLRSLRRNPILTALIITGIALGVGVASSFNTVHRLVSAHPIPEKRDTLFQVFVDIWPHPFFAERPEEPPTQISYRDMVALMQSKIPTYQNGSFRAYVFIHPPGKEIRPYKANVRSCFADFFPMFNVPFVYGSGWSRDADLAGEQVVVLNQESNQRIFGGQNSVGKSIRIVDREFRVVGVVDWRRTPKFYDTTNGAFSPPEAFFIPLNTAAAMEIRSSGNQSNAHAFGPTYQDLLSSETIWIQMWVQLDTLEQQEAYRDFLRSYGSQQKRVGRAPRAEYSRILSVTEWLEHEHVVSDRIVTLRLISFLFLIVCSLNLVGILLGKFLARSPEIGVRRALGASKLAIFSQHILECQVVALVGGALGIFISYGALAVINRWLGQFLEYRLDSQLAVSAVLFALVAGLIAGVYPAWRICSIPAAVHLKEQ